MINLLLSLAIAASTPILTPTPTSKGYEVYPGCEAPSATFTRTITLDPAKETLKSFLDAKKLIQGDHLILLPGDHGNITLKYMTLGTGWTWFDFKQGAKVSGFLNVGKSKLLLTGMSSSGNTMLRGGQDVVITGSNISGGNADKWTVDDWINAPNAINADAAKCVSITNNKITNVRFGVTVMARAKGGDHESTVIKALIKNNTLDGMSADFFRPLGSDVSIVGNRGVNGMVSQPQGDGNHDDFIQMFAYPLGVASVTSTDSTGAVKIITPAVPAAIYDNVKITDNTFIEWDGTRKSLRGEYQGISCFDGEYSNLEVSRNTVLASAYWLIHAGSAHGFTVDHNTVINVYPSGNRKGRISASNGKLGIPADHVSVTNNVTNFFSITTCAKAACSAAELTKMNNFQVPNGQEAKYFTKFDKVAGIFDLTPLKSGPIYGKGAGSK